ncbi:MAG: hypothetical protein R6V28_07560 [Nitriliruptoraceae bacterium]
MVDLHTNDTLVRVRLAEDTRRAAQHRLRRRSLGRRLRGRMLGGGATGRGKAPGRPGAATFELERAA